MSYHFGQIAEGNDFHRRALDVKRMEIADIRDKQRAANIKEWQRRQAAHIDAGEHETARNIGAFLAAGYD